MRGDRLKQLRDAMGLSQSDLAEQLDISEPQIWRYEHGDSKPRGDVVVKFATFFGVSSDYLLGLNDDPGIHIEGDLSPKERQVISALRHGNKFEAIKVITEDG